MLTPDEQDQLAHELLDWIEERAADLVADQDDRRAWLAAILEVDAGLRAVGPRVSRALEGRALREGMSQAAVARARGTTRQAVNGRVRAG